MVENHVYKPFPDWEAEMAAHIPAGGNWKSVPYEALPERLKRIKDDMRKYHSPAFYQRASWDGPAGTISATMNPTHCQAIHPGHREGEVETMEYNVTPQMPDNGLTIAELFAGGGLMAVGLKSAGFSIKWANDFEKAPCTAYAHNIGPHIVHADITTIDPDAVPDTDIIAGGPPCQDFSTAGKGAGEEGDRGKLVWTYLNIITVKQPKAFIFENVPGLASKKHLHTLEALLEQFNEAGYTVSWRLINSWDYGVAQVRNRIFIVGIRNDLGLAYQFPDPKPEGFQTQMLRDVIGDLPEPSEFYYSQPRNYAKRAVVGANEPAPTIKEHNSRPMPPNYKPHPRDAHIVNHDPKPLTEVQQAYLDRNPDSVAKNRPVAMDEPSRTLPAVMHKGIPYGLAITQEKQPPRRFTVRECLRIQSVPDWYVLPQTVSMSAQYKIVGNGVASRVAYLLGIALAEQLKNFTPNVICE